MKYGINLYLWADDMHDGLMPVLEKLKKMGYDGVEVPIFDLDLAKWKLWAKRLDDLGLERTANTVIAPEHNPLSADPKVRDAAYQHMRGVVDACAAVGSPILCGPHQVALGVFTGKGATEEEWKRSIDHLRRVAEYAAGQGVVLAEEVVNRFELYHVNVLDQGIRLASTSIRSMRTSKRRMPPTPSAVPATASLTFTSPRTTAASREPAASRGTQLLAPWATSATTGGSQSRRSAISCRTWQRPRRSGDRCSTARNSSRLTPLRS